MKNSTKKSALNYSSVSDKKNNSYRSILIQGGILGVSQEWFADNLNVDCFKNGDPIIQAQSFEDWMEAYNSKTPAWCYFPGNENAGKLYNLPAILDERGLAPEGFIIPDLIDFSILGFNTQELEPMETNTMAFDLDRNWRMDPEGLASGAMKLMAKEGWKKKGKNTSGLSIIGTGQRIGNSYQEGFRSWEEQCTIWIKPTGAYFSIQEENREVGWIELNEIKEDLPAMKIDASMMTKSILSKNPILMSKSDYETLSKIRMSFFSKTQYELGTRYYPFNRKEGVDEMYFNHAVACLLDYYSSNRRNGVRTAVFASGKNKIWYSLSDEFQGAFVRPFRYV